MSHLEAEAKHHAERIEHYYTHAGTLGYGQAQHHFTQLSRLVQHAGRSTRGRASIQAIQCYISRCAPLMKEMRQRQGATDGPTLGSSDEP